MPGASRVAWLAYFTLTVDAKLVNMTVIIPLVLCYILLGKCHGIDIQEYAFPLFIPPRTETIPNILFLNDGPTPAVVNVSVHGTDMEESMVVYTQTTFMITDLLHIGVDLEIEGPTLEIRITTSAAVHPYISQRSLPSVLLLPIVEIGKEYYLYDAFHYNPTSYCLDILSLGNDIHIQFGSVVANENNIKENDNFQMEEHEMKRICGIGLTRLTELRLVSSQPVVLILSTDTTGDSQTILAMMVPYSYWGKTFTVMPIISHTHRHIVRILAAHSNTTIHLGNNSTVVMDSSEYIDIDVTQPVTLTSETPVFVTISVLRLTNGNLTIDSSMDDVLSFPVIPVQQYIDRTYIHTPIGSNTSKAFITTVCSGIPEMTFNGEALDVKTNVIITPTNGSEFCLISIPLEPDASHELRSFWPTVTFTIVIYEGNAKNIYNVGFAGQEFTCVTLMYGQLLYEHECDVLVYVQNTSCPICDSPENKSCKFCITRDILIVVGVVSAVASVLLNIFCQTWYCPRRQLKAVKKLAEQNIEKMEEKKRKREELKMKEIKYAKILKERKEKEKQFQPKSPFVNLVTEIASQPKDK